MPETWHSTKSTPSLHCSETAPRAAELHSCTLRRHPERHTLFRAPPSLHFGCTGRRQSSGTCRRLIVDTRGVRNLPIASGPSSSGALERMAMFRLLAAFEMLVFPKFRHASPPGGAAGVRLVTYSFFCNEQVFADCSSGPGSANVATRRDVCSERFVTNTFVIHSRCA
jgi:hypothetical protein